ncbi:hypothetical protein IWZ01DRAFT_483330 [Phyllosticta capitalensis]
MSEPIGPRPQPPVLRKNHFKLDCKDGQWRFTVDDIERMKASRLAELFAPESFLQKKRDQNAARKEADKLFLKKFHVAQLRHYGIDFRESAPKGQVQNILRDAVLGGQCQIVPESVLNLQQEMQTEYDPLYQNWAREARAWDEGHRQTLERMRQQEEKPFAKLTTPIKRARKDPERFLKTGPNHYPGAARLTGLDKARRMEIHQLVEWRYRGLHTQSGGQGKNRALCIGWSRDAVWDLARSLENKAKEKQRRKQQSEHEEWMESHRQYVSSLGQDGPRQPFGLPKCQGSYYIRCDKVMRQYSNTHPDELWLDIGPGMGGSLEADFSFGVIEGTMLLDVSDQRVADVAYELDPNDEDEYSQDEEEEEEEDEEEEQEEEEDPQPSALGKRAAPTASGPAKKQKTTAPPSRRIYFRMRGRETGEGEIFSIPEPGHIEFLDDDCTRFVGVMYDNNLIPKNTEFRGFKIGEEPEETPEDWNAFSEKAYQYERRMRWRR